MATIKIKLAKQATSKQASKQALACLEKGRKNQGKNSRKKLFCGKFCS